MSTKDFDYCYVTETIEYFPGCKLTVPLSVEFTDREIAKACLRNIQAINPNAKLAYVNSNNCTDDQDYVARIKMTSQRDEFYRKRFLINH